MTTLIAIVGLLGMLAAAALSFGKAFEAVCNGISKLRHTKAPAPVPPPNIYLIVGSDSSARAIPPSEEGIRDRGLARDLGTPGRLVACDCCSSGTAAARKPLFGRADRDLAP
jgi:hypothetical protein